MLESLFSRLTEVAGGNQLVAGAISMWALGVITYACRTIPRNVGGLLKKHLTTTLTVTSNHESFYRLLRWFDRTGLSARFRCVKLSNGMWGEERNTAKSVGYGTHLFWYRGRPLIVRLIEKENTAANTRDKETLTLCKLGRSHRLLDNLLEDGLASTGEPEFTCVYKYIDGCWRLIGKQAKRPWDSVFLTEYNKRRLQGALSAFLGKEDWYKKAGIPYQLGVLLYGPAGTGKTSVIKSVAGMLDRDIRIIPAHGVGDLAGALANIDTKRSVFVIEDVDTCSLTHHRNGSTPQEDDSILAMLKPMGLSDVLNALDGIVSIHGRMLFMTTNHIERLDDALLRPGRIDLKLELGYVDEDIFRQFMERFYGEQLNGVRLTRNDLTVAELQEQVLLGAEAEDLKTAWARGVRV